LFETALINAFSAPAIADNAWDRRQRAGAPIPSACGNYYSDQQLEHDHAIVDRSQDRFVDVAVVPSCSETLRVITAEVEVAV
jgi:hypothetical protein